MSWLFTRPEGMDEFVNVRSAMLEDFQHYRPFIETYLDEKIAWAVTGAVHSFKTFPPQELFAGLLKEYAVRQ
jgi:hypothetical protein